VNQYYRDYGVKLEHVLAGCLAIQELPMKCVLFWSLDSSKITIGLDELMSIGKSAAFSPD